MQIILYLGFFITERILYYKNSLFIMHKKYKSDLCGKFFQMKSIFKILNSNKMHDGFTATSLNFLYAMKVKHQRNDS